MTDQKGLQPDQKVSSGGGAAASVSMSRRSFAGAVALGALHPRASLAAEGPTDPSLLDAERLQAAYRAGSLAPTEVVGAVFKRIDVLNPAINAFIVVDRDGARAAAEASETRWRTGKPLGPLDGVPVSLKDNIPWAGHPTRKGSRTSADTATSEDSPLAARLLSSGAVVLGKTCMPEFGWKGVGDSPLTGVTRNPWNTQLTSGGSTAGGAAAAALNLGAVHFGTDGAGSLRIPAAFCGVFGFKPSLGRIPAVPAAPTLHLGPVSRTVRDAAVALQVLSGPDPRDITASHAPMPDLVGALGAGVEDLRIGWSPRLGYVGQLDPEVEDIAGRAANAFSHLGAKVEQADPGFPDPTPILEPIWLTIAWSAVRQIPESRWRELDPGLLALAERGRGVSGADYAMAFGARASLHAAMARFNKRYDLLLTPTVAVPAFEIGRNTPPSGAYGENWLNWAPYTYPFNLTLHPAASIPCGFTKGGRPVGLQIVGSYLREDMVLRAARAYERAHPWPFIDVPRAT